MEPAIFLAGITGLKCKAKDNWETYFSEDPVGAHHPSVLLQSVYEARNPTMVQQCFSVGRRNVFIGDQNIVDGNNQWTYTLTAIDCYALSYCLANSSDNFHLCVSLKNNEYVSQMQAFLKG